MRRISIALPVLLLACGEEKKPDPNPPTIVEALVQCRPVEGVMTLDEVNFVVEDLDGADDLDRYAMTVEATRLEAMTETLPNAEDPSEDAVRVRYSWKRNQDSEQVFCGDDGELLQVTFEVYDVEGFPARARQPSKPLR